MNSKRFFILILLTACFSIHSFAQKNIQKKYTNLLEGTWLVDSLELGDLNLTPEYRKIVQEKLREVIDKTQIQFNPGQKYHKDGVKISEDGTWSVSPDGKYIIIKLEGSSERSKSKIIEISEKKLIIAPENPESTNSKVYLYKKD